MCGRFALYATPEQLIDYFGLDECTALSPRYNIPPGTDIAAIRKSPEGKRVLHLLRWGLVPHWAKDTTIGNKLNNARGESVADKPAFREAFKRHRCLIPADGFYEWKPEGKMKQPFFISLTTEGPMAMAGLWSSWKGPDGEILRTCCVITTGANDLMAPIHDRMPVIIDPAHWEAWLSAPADEVLDLVAPHGAKDMQAWPVSRRVSKSVEDTADLMHKMPG